MWKGVEEQKASLRVHCPDASHKLRISLSFGEGDYSSTGPIAVSGSGFNFSFAIAFYVSHAPLQAKKIKDKTTEERYTRAGACHACFLPWSN